MGSGKTTVGQMLARALQWRFIDLDHYIEQSQGKSITALFDELGEAGFRLLEHEALKEVAALKRVVVSTGGGAPCFHKNMQLMRSKGLTIYLQLSPEVLYERLLPARKSRPLLAGKSDEELLDFIRQKLAEREDYYKQAAVHADATAVGVAPYLNIIERYNQLEG